MTENPVFAPVAGMPLMLAPDLALVLAPNPSPMTYLGTNTYLLGRDQLAVIDPGPADQTHLAALEAAIAGREVTHIFVTHSHLDHSALAPDLARQTGAPVYAFGDSKAGRSAIMTTLAKSGLADGGEGIDHSFMPDQILQDGTIVSGAWGRITAVHTPGHLGNHMCLCRGNTVFTGDHVMGWASSLVSPPDGDLTDFMASCEKLKTVPADIYYPAHGAPIRNPMRRLDWLISHRRSRELQIMQALQISPGTAAQLTNLIYQETPDSLLKAAQRNVLAHLVDLHQRRKVSARDTLSEDTVFWIS